MKRVVPDLIKRSTVTALLICEIWQLKARHDARQRAILFTHQPQATAGRLGEHGRQRRQRSQHVAIPAFAGTPCHVAGQFSGLGSDCFWLTPTRLNNGRWLRHWHQ